MEVDLYTPKNPILKKYIDYFYFLNRKSTDEEITYLGFPTTSIYVIVCKNVNFQINKQNISIQESKNKSIHSLLICDTKISGEMNYKGAISEITICFKPLGINVFLDKDFSNYHTDIISTFEFEPNFKDTLTTIFNIESNESKVNALENYFVSILKRSQNNILSQIISEIHNSSENFPTVNELCQKYAITRPTLNSYFKKHLGTNPSQYIKIVRFRKTIKQFTSQNNTGNLVNVSYLTDYFDQSHMIKDFISLTGYTPKHFFKNISQYENGQINWLFL